MKKNSLLPIMESDKPDDIIKKDKKDLTILLIIGLVALSIAMLTAFIAFIVYEKTGYAFLALFIGAFVMTAFIVRIKNAHNAARRTVALMKMAEVVMGEESIPDELLVEVLNNRKTAKYIEQPKTQDESDKKDNEEI